ncbi:Transposon Tf2-11 polyprotein [Dictyocoela roeselum]|nr:Transposon Tf2-11 polyprotein [Dictyocoela roeselum]
MTDNKNLTFNGELTKRIERWKLTLEEYNYTLVHIEGKENQEADSLSRVYPIPHETPKNKNSHLEIDLNEFNKIMSDTNTNESKSKDRIIAEFIKKIHDNLIHPGATKLKMTLKNYMNFPRMNRYIDQICSNCHTWNISKEFSNKCGVTQNEISAIKPNECVALDIKGPIKSYHFRNRTKNKYFYILVMTDIFSRYTEAAIIKNVESKTVIESFLKKWISIHGSPRKCLTDNGRQFISEKFEQLLQENKIAHIKSSPYNPTGNSIIERVNKDIGNVLRISRNLSLSTLLKNIWTRINLNANISTGRPPYEIFFGKPIFKNMPMKNPVDYNKVLSNLKYKTQLFNDKMKAKRKNIVYKEGDLIYLKNFSAEKVHPKWLGPYKVVKLSNSKNNIFINKANKVIRASIKHVRPFKGGEDVAPRPAATIGRESKEDANLSKVLESDKTA